MIRLMMDDAGTGAEFDRELQWTLPCGEDVSVISKANATREGRAAVLVKFPVQLPDGRVADAQYVFTAREFVSAADAVAATHPSTRDKIEPQAPPGTVIHKFHRGVGYNAVCVKKVYIVNIEGRPGISLAWDEAEVKAIGEKMVDMLLFGKAAG